VLQHEAVSATGAEKEKIRKSELRDISCGIMVEMLATTREKVDREMLPDSLFDIKGWLRSNCIGGVLYGNKRGSVSGCTQPSRASCSNQFPCFKVSRADELLMGSGSLVFTHFPLRLDSPASWLRDLLLDSVLAVSCEATSMLVQSILYLPSKFCRNAIN
jgi:hypothetical protein